MTAMDVLGAVYLIAIICVCSSVAWRYEQTLHDKALSPSYGRILGDSIVDYDGSVAIAAANDTCATLLHSGCSYNEWNAEDFPLPTNESTDEVFVQSVRYNGRLLVVGAASRSGEFDGRVYVYHTGVKNATENLTEPQVIFPPINDTDQTRYFGTVISIAAISRHFAVSLPESSKVVVYENSTNEHGSPLEPVAILEAPADKNEYYKRVFGMSSAMSDNILVVGAPVIVSPSAVNGDNGDDVIPDGLLFTFVRNETWSPTPSILNPRKLFPDLPPMPLFGYALDITKDGTRMVVTLPCMEPPILNRPTNFDVNKEDSGSSSSSSSHSSCVPIAFVFIWDNGVNDWKLVYNVTAPEDAVTTSFGARVSINPEEGDIFVGVGAPSENQALSSVYLFRNHELYAHIPSIQDSYAFGNSMTMYGDILAVGVPLQAIGMDTLNGMTILNDDGETQMGGIVMYSISQLSDNMMTVVMSCTLLFFLLLVIAVLTVYKLHPSSIAAIRSQHHQRSG